VIYSTRKFPEDLLIQVFEVMEQATWHTFQVLTKRSSLLRDFLKTRYDQGRGPEHIWLGVSVEDSTKKSRIRHLRDAPAGVRFISIEPLIGRIGQLDLDGIHWVIAGGESGPGARPVHPDWVREIRDQCAANRVAFFFKQWGGLRPKSGGRELDGSYWDQFPSISRQTVTTANRQ
jgi:protein gp37